MNPHQGLGLEVVLPLDRLRSSSIALACIQVAEQAGLKRADLRLYGESLAGLRLDDALRERRSFLIEGERLSVHLACISNHSLALLSVRGIESRWLDKFAEQLVLCSSLISCRWHDEEYDYWQNAEDPMLYRLAGRALDGLVLKDNGLPPPLDQQVVDTSGNPGRRLLRDGYVEAVGHRMWLGAEFFRRVPGASRQVVCADSSFTSFVRADDVVAILAAEKAFVDDSSDLVQRRLRGLLFPTTTGVE